MSGHELLEQQYTFSDAPNGGLLVQIKDKKDFPYRLKVLRTTKGEVKGARFAGLLAQHRRGAKVQHAQRLRCLRDRILVPHQPSQPYCQASACAQLATDLSNLYRKQEVIYLCPKGHMRKTPYMGTCGECRSNEHRRKARAEARPRTYVTQPGESLVGIACRELGDEKRWTEIRDLNEARFECSVGSDYFPVFSKIKLPPKRP